MTTMAELHQDVGKLQGQVHALTAEVTMLRTEVKGLTAVLHQLRGARYVLILGYSVIAGLGGLLGYLGIRFTTT